VESWRAWRDVEGSIVKCVVMRRESYSSIAVRCNWRPSASRALAAGIEIRDRVGVLRVSREPYIMWLLLQKYWNLVGWNIGIDVASEVLQRRM
jgi:hypothetical protein